MADANEEQIAKLTALREAVNDPRSIVDLKTIFNTIIDAVLETLKS